MERMTPCVIRVVLSGVVFRDDAVAGKIQDQSGLVGKDVLEELLELVFLNDGRQGDVRADMKRVATLGRELQERVSGLGKELKKLFIGLHHGISRVGSELSDDDTLWHIELSFRIINAGDFIENIDVLAFLSADYFAGIIRDLDVGRQVHLSAFY